MKNENVMLSIVAICAIVGIVLMITLSVNNKNSAGSIVSAYSDSAGLAYLSGFAVNSIDVEEALGCTWSDWKNRDSPGGSGDWETTTSFSDICTQPLEIECQTLFGVD